MSRSITAEQIVVKVRIRVCDFTWRSLSYYNGKVPFDAILSEELITGDPNYQLGIEYCQPSERYLYYQGCKAKYYLYLTNAKETSNVRSVDEITFGKRQIHLTGRRREPVQKLNRVKLLEKHKTSSRQVAAYAAGKRTYQAEGTASRVGAMAPIQPMTAMFQSSDVISDTGDGFLVPLWRSYALYS